MSGILKEYKPEQNSKPSNMSVWWTILETDEEVMKQGQNDQPCCIAQLGILEALN